MFVDATVNGRDLRRKNFIIILYCLDSPALDLFTADRFPGI